MSYEGMTAYTYARVSTADHDQDPETQHHAIRKWCAEQGIEIKGEFSDHVSGGEMTRAGLSQMLGQIIIDPVSMVVMLSPDRLTRDMHDSDKLVEKFKALGVVIRYVSNGVKPETEEGQLIHYLESYSGQKYRTETKIKVKAGLERAKAQGKVCHRPAVPVDVDAVINYAKSGLTMSSMCPLFVYKLKATNPDGTPIVKHVSREHIRHALVNAGRMEEYNAIRKEVRR